MPCLLTSARAQIYEKSPDRVKNFGIWFRYESRTGTHNAYKEYRELALTDAISAMYQDMAGRSRAKAVAIQVLKTAELKPEDCKRTVVKQFHSSAIKFPLPHRVAKTPKQFKTTFKASRPTVSSAAAEKLHDDRQNAQRRRQIANAATSAGGGVGAARKLAALPLHTHLRTPFRRDPLLRFLPRTPSLTHSFVSPFAMLRPSANRAASFLLLRMEWRRSGRESLGTRWCMCVGPPTV